MKKTVLAVVVALGAVQPAHALKINLINVGGAEQGTQAYRGFRVAAGYWESVLGANATVNLQVGFEKLDPNVLGSTGSSYWVTSARGVQTRIAANAQTSLAIQAAANLPTLDRNGGLRMITPGYNDTANQLGVDARTRVYDNDGSFNNRVLGITSANAKALGYNVGNDVIDANIRFNSDFRFTFDPRTGLDGDRINFIQVAVHEIGHALGFVSGVDGYDFVGCPNGPGCTDFRNYDANNDWWGSSLDLYRYSANPTNVVTNTDPTVSRLAGPTLDWSIRNASTDGAAFAQPYFSIDGGKTALFNGLMSRGQFNTNSYQASHWRSNVIPGQAYLGIMDPVGQNDKDYAVTALDLAAFDAIGWKSRIDALKDSSYRILTGDILATSTVPEPQTWAMMIVGFGMVGFAMRRRRQMPRAVAA